MGLPSTSCRRAATGRRLKAGSTCPCGRPRCDAKMTLAPSWSAYEIVGSAARMRVSSVTSPALLSGTLKSTRTNRRLPRIAISRRVALDISSFLSQEPALRNLFASICEIVHQNVIADVFRGGEEGAPTINLSQLVDKALHIIVLAEHEGVDRNAIARTALHFPEGLQQGALRGRVFQTDLAIPNMGGGLAISDQNHLLIHRMLAGQEAGCHL